MATDPGILCYTSQDRVGLGGGLGWRVLRDSTVEACLITNLNFPISLLISATVVAEGVPTRLDAWFRDKKRVLI